MNNLSTYINRVISGCLSLSLLLTPTSFSYAKDGNRKLNNVYKKEFKQISNSAGSNMSIAKDVMNIVDTTGALLGQLQQQKMQQRAQMQQMQMNQTLQQSLTPKPVPDDFFPNCQILQAKSDRIDGLCETIESENSYLEVLAVQQSAKMNANLIENHFIDGNKMGDTSGLQCFKENAKALRVQLKDRLVKIDALLADLQKANAIFEQNVQQDENQLKEINGLLNGGDGFEFNSENRDLSGLFQDKSCASVITLNAESSSQNGLIGLRKEIDSKGVTKARELTSRRKSIERDFRNDLKILTNDISSKLSNNENLEGIESYGLDYLGPIKKEYGNVLREYKNEKTALQTEIKQLGPEGATFASELADPTATLKVTLRNWERNTKNNCFDQAVTQKLETFKTKAREINPNISRGGTNIRDYFRTINSILKNNPHWTLEQKIKEIKAEEAKFGYGSIRVQMGTSLRGHTQNRNWKISDAITTYANDCVTKFNSITNAKGLTNRDIIKKAKKIHAKYERLSKKTPQKIANRLTARFLRCEGVGYSDTPADCNSSKLDTSGDNFCLDQSLRCASAMTSCYAKADKIVKQKQIEQKNVAKVYNDKVRSFKKIQLDLFDRVEKEFKFVSNGLKSYFPGASFDIPFDLNYNPQKDGFEKKHGVQLIATKDFMANMVDNVKAIKEKIKAQNEKIIGDVDATNGEFAGIVGDKINTIKVNYEKELEYWSGLSTKCDELGKEFIAQRDKSIAEQNQAIAENNEKVNRFCSTIETITHTPGCGKVSDLTDTAFEIADEIGVSSGDAAALGSFASYQAVCESSQSHDYDDSRGPASNLSVADFCKLDDYKSSKNCKSWKSFNDTCTETYYSKIADLKENHDLYKDKCELVDETTKPAKCSDYKKDYDEYKKYKTTHLTKCGDADTRTDKEIAVLEPLEESLIAYSSKMQIEEIRKDVGEQSFEVCNAQEGSSRGIVKGFLDDLRDMDNMNSTLAQDI